MKEPGMTSTSPVGVFIPAAALVAEINLRRVGVAMVGTHLPGLPAGHRHVALLEAAQNLLHVLFLAEFLFFLQIENVHLPLLCV